MTLDIKSTDMKKIRIVKSEQTEYTTPLEIAEPKKKKWGVFVVLGVILIVVGGIAFGVYKGLAVFKGIGLKIDAGSLSLKNVEPELKKDSSGKYTNCLIIGIDTRGASEGLNTDTIILASYNYDTSNVVMLSLPRDLSVEIGEGSKWYSKINAVYAFTKDDDDTAGLKELQRTVEEMTGTEIQYYAMVNFDGFTQIVDAVGGVDISVENSFTDYNYPLGTSYQTVSFKSGIQTMDGETALKYARSRHSDDNGEGSDFMRARRQQRVIMAIKDKILSTSTLTNPKAVMGMISSVADNLKVSEFTISDIQAVLNVAQDFNEKNAKTFSFVLDPASGNSQLIGNLSTYGEDGTLLAYVIGPKLGLGKYTDTREFVSLIMTNPALYSDDATVYVYNTGLGSQEVTNKVKALQDQYPYLSIIYMGTLYSGKEGDYIYSHTENEFTTTVNEFAAFLDIENKTKPEYVTNNLNGEDVTILLGKAIQLEQ